MTSFLHLATGGTIDSAWDPAADTARPRATSIIPQYLEKAARIRGVVSETLFMKDSRETTIADRRHVADRVAETSADRVIVTGGTFLAGDIARRIEKHPMATHFTALDRRVVLAAAIKPIDGYLRSDGGFNLGVAYASLQQETLDRVSVVVNGGCFRGSDVEKDMTVATFSGMEGHDQLPYEQFDLVTVGGSIDFGNDGLDRVVPKQESGIPRYLRDDVRLVRRFFSINPFLKDSRQMTPENLETILEMVRRAKTDRVLVTSGLVRIKELADFLRERLGEAPDKTVVLTGSRHPLNDGDMTDAPFNLGYALGRIGFLGKGVHVALAGRVLAETEDPLPHMYTPEEQEAVRAQNLTFTK